MESEIYLDIKDLDTLMLALQKCREEYGNISVDMDMCTRKDEGNYNIDAILYSKDEDGNNSISLISW